jgi:alcohol dehydrogenase
MKAIVYREFAGPLTIEDVAMPHSPKRGVVIEVKAAGICRSDWHGWMGNDPDIKLPHVPGHEFAGVVADVGRDVKSWNVGDRVTLPFVCGCGNCEQCRSGNHQVCDHQFQPGFTHWGAFAEYVAIDHADANLVRLPDEMDFVTAASLGCRFITSFRAVVDQGKVAAGQFVAVHGSGGVGLSAIMIAHALGANVVAIDIDDSKLALAQSIGADFVLNARSVANVVGAIREITNGGAHVSIDALGSPETCLNSVLTLRKRGKHVQVGIMESGDHLTSLPIDKIIARELEIIGSHGMQAYRFPEMLEMIADGRLHPDKLIGKTISLDESAQALANMNAFASNGITVINEF